MYYVLLFLGFNFFLFFIGFYIFLWFCVFYVFFWEFRFFFWKLGPPSLLEGLEIRCQVKESTCHPLGTVGPPLALPFLHWGSILLPVTRFGVTSFIWRLPLNIVISVEKLAFAVIVPPAGWVIFASTFPFITSLVMYFMHWLCEVPLWLNCLPLISPFWLAMFKTTLIGLKVTTGGSISALHLSISSVCPIVNVLTFIMLCHFCVRFAGLIANFTLIFLFLSFMITVHMSIQVLF